MRPPSRGHRFTLTAGYTAEQLIAAGPCHCTRRFEARRVRRDRVGELESPVVAGSLHSRWGLICCQLGPLAVHVMTHCEPMSIEAGLVTGGKVHGRRTRAPPPAMSDSAIGRRESHVSHIILYSNCRHGHCQRTGIRLTYAWRAECCPATPVRWRGAGKARRGTIRCGRGSG